MISINGVFDHLTADGVVAWYYCLDIDGMYLVRGTIQDVDTEAIYYLGKVDSDTALIATYKEQGSGVLRMLKATTVLDSDTGKYSVDTKEVAELHNYIYWSNDENT